MINSENPILKEPRFIYNFAIESVCLKFLIKYENIANVHGMCMGVSS